jgi:single-strand DNA-binding protein
MNLQPKGYGVKCNRSIVPAVERRVTQFKKENSPMYHTLIIVGNVGKDPEMRYTPSGQAVTSFSVATNRQYTGSNGEQVKETIWFRVSAWGKTAEVCNQYVKKGSKVLVEGRLTPDKATGGPKIWTKQDGTAGASYEVTANNVRFLSSRQEGGDGGASGPMDAGDITAPTEDNIPF